MVSNPVRRFAIATIGATVISMCALPVRADNVADAKKLVDAGLQHSRSGQPQLALADFQKASTLSSGDANIWSHVANCYNALGQHKQAIESINKAIAIAPDDVNLISTRAAMCLYAKDTPSCLKDIKTVLAKDPDNRNALFLTGTCQIQLGQTSKALEVYKRIIKQPERDSLYYQAAGFLYLFQKQYAQAADVLLEGERKCPNELVLHHFRAQALSSLGRFREVIKEESYLLKDNLTAPESAQLRGAAYLMIGEYKKAAIDLQRALATKPDDTGALCLLLTCATRSNDLPLKNDVARRLRIAAQGIKDDKELARIANVERDCGYGQNALTCLKTAIQIRKDKGSLDANSVEDLANAARLCAESKKTDEAIEYYKLAAACSKDDPTYLIELGKLHVEQKQFPEAERYLNTALEKIDIMRRPKVLNLLAVVYRAQNKTAQAAKSEKEAHKITKTIYEHNP